MATVTIYTKAGAEELERNPTHTHDYLTEDGLGDSVFNELQNRLQQGTGVTIDVDAENAVAPLNAFHDFVSDPGPFPGRSADQHCGDRSSLQL